MANRAIVIGSRDGDTSLSNTGNEPSNFQQQGTIDWTSLSANSISATVEVLKRLSTAGIDAYTVLVARAIGGSISWSESGRKRFDVALRSSKGFSGYKDVLWFGFGVKHITRILTFSDQGAVCTNLCACLAECYDVSFVAEVMFSLTTALEPPPEMLNALPSLQQWKQLVNSCAGLLSTSNFGLRAEHFMSLNGEHRIASHGSKCFQLAQGTLSRGVTSNEALAEVIRGLGKLSKGVLHNMTVIGGSDAGFIAALAEWMLDLSVQVQRAEDSETIYTNCETSHPQLLIIFQRDSSIEELQCIGQIFRLPNASQLMKSALYQTPSTCVLTGRVVWGQALSHTFGGEFQRLLSLKEAFGSAIGSAARIYTAVSRADKEVDRDLLQNCRYYFDESYGRAYCHLSRSAFPELEPLNDIIAKASRVYSVSEAVSAYEAQISVLQYTCNCSVCDANSRGTRATQEAFCLVALTETIIRLVRALSGIILDYDILPTRSGLELFYDHQVASKWPVIDRTGTKGKVAPVHRIIENPSAVGGEMHPLLVAACLFGGHRYNNTIESGQFVSALSNTGLCYYFDFLREPSLDATLMARVHVVPGSIEHQDRRYNMLVDSDLAPVYSGEPRPPVILPDSLVQGIKSYEGRSLEVLVKETVTSSLSIQYGVTMGREILRTFGPARVIDAVMRGRGLVPCDRRSDCKVSSSLKDATKDLAIISPITSVQIATVKVAIFPGDLTTRLLATSQLWDPIIRSDECFACCIRAGMAFGWPHLAVICQITPSAGDYESALAERSV